MQTITHRVPPSHQHATCAWCDERFETIAGLLDHVDGAHLEPPRHVPRPNNRSRLRSQVPQTVQATHTTAPPTTGDATEQLGSP